MRSDFLIGIAGSAQQKNLRPLWFELRQSETDALLRFRTKKDLQTVLGPIGRGSFVKNLASNFHVTSSSAQIIDAQIHGGAIKPPGNVGAGDWWQDAAVQLQKGFVGQFFRTAGIAQHAAEKGDEARISRQKEFVEGLGRQWVSVRGRHGAQGLRQWFDDAFQHGCFPLSEGYTPKAGEL